MLYKGWHELFVGGYGQDIDSNGHIPPGPLRMLHEILQEVYTEAFNIVQDRVANNSLEDAENDPDHELLGLFANGMAAVAYRMYLLGQHMMTRLPASELTPCNCVTIGDDELEGWLQNLTFKRDQDTGVVIKKVDEEGDDEALPFSEGDGR
jgi:hypothetical protein